MPDLQTKIDTKENRDVNGGVSVVSEEDGEVTTVVADEASTQEKVPEEEVKEKPAAAKVKATRVSSTGSRRQSRPESRGDKEEAVVISSSDDEQPAQQHCP